MNIIGHMRSLSVFYLNSKFISLATDMMSHLKLCLHYDNVFLDKNDSVNDNRYVLYFIIMTSSPSGK